MAGSFHVVNRELEALGLRCGSQGISVQKIGAVSPVFISAGLTTDNPYMCIVVGARKSRFADKFLVVSIHISSTRFAHEQPSGTTKRLYPTCSTCQVFYERRASIAAS